MSGIWISVEDAFALAIEAEGVPAVAFYKFCDLIKKGTVSAQAARRHGEWGTGRVSLFQFSSWEVVDFAFTDLVLHVGDNDENQLWIGKECFDVASWNIVLKREDFESQFSARAAQPVPISEQLEVTRSEKRGRPKLDLWEDVLIEAAGRVYEGTYSAIQPLLDDLELHFGQKFGQKGPKQTALREHVTPLFVRMTRKD